MAAVEEYESTDSESDGEEVLGESWEDKELATDDDDAARDNGDDDDDDDAAEIAAAGGIVV